MSKVLRVGGKFASKMERLQKEYSQALGKNVKMTRITDGLADRLDEEGYFNFWARDAKKKRGRKK